MVVVADCRREVLQLLTTGALRVDEALELLAPAPAADSVELLLVQASGRHELLRVVLPRRFVEAAGAAGLRLRLGVGEPPLAITWADLLRQLLERGQAEVVDQRAGVVARLSRGST